MKAKKIFFFIFLYFLFTNESQSQTILSHNFDNPNWGEWENTQDWRLDSSYKLEDQNSLQHNVFHRSGFSYIAHKTESFTVQSQNTKWEFVLKTEDWITGENERYGFFLTADRKDLSLANGIAIGVNLYQPSAQLEICAIINGIATEQIYVYPKTWNANVAKRIRITLSNKGFWSLQWKDHNKESWSDTIEFTTIDTHYRISEYCGFFFQFSANHAGQFWVDDLTIEKTEMPPYLETPYFSTPTSIRLHFSKPIDPSSLTTLENIIILDEQKQHIAVDNIHPTSENYDDFEILFDTITTNFCDLIIDNIVDKKGDPLESNGDTTRVDYAIFPKQQDLIFSEIMYDPPSTSGLVGHEYIEVMNRANYPITLSETEIHIGNDSEFLPDYILPPRSYCIVSDYEDSITSHQIHIEGLSLRNSGNHLCLKTKSIINDSISYSPEYWDGDSKSIERIDVDRSCGFLNNWTSSIDPQGGSPGVDNSVSRNNIDSIPPFIQEIHFNNSQSATIYFSESIEEIEQSSITSNDEQDISFLQFSDSIQIQWTNRIEFGESISLLLPNIFDLCGNILPSKQIEIQNREPIKGSLLFSEILYEPKPDCEEYIELYNNSEFEIDLSSLFLGVLEDDNKTVNKWYRPLSGKNIIFADEYAVLSKDTTSIKKEFSIENPELLFQADESPTLTNDGEILILKNKEDVEIDRMRYAPSSHAIQMRTTQGVSLERIDFLKSGMDTENWTSTSSIFENGTPTSANSQSINSEHRNDEWVWFESENFSPNADGYLDEIIFHINLSDNDWNTTVEIYNSIGKRILILENNQRIGTSTTLSWDGLDAHSKLVSMGIYIILIQVDSPNGKSKTKKQAIALSDRID